VSLHDSCITLANRLANDVNKLPWDKVIGGESVTNRQHGIWRHLELLVKVLGRDVLFCKLVPRCLEKTPSIAGLAILAANDDSVDVVYRACSCFHNLAILELCSERRRMTSDRVVEMSARVRE